MTNTELVILRELNAAPNEFVSGAQLATKLSISRVAIWQHMEKLRREGFEFEAVRARGYRISKHPTALHAIYIEAILEAKQRTFPLTVLDEVDSTNDEAARQLADGRQTPFVILARKQTKGRGRFGRVWHSDDHHNLYSSFAFRPQLAPHLMPTFTLWMGVNICELITNFCSMQAGLKWPNDIVFDGRKAGGMLTEARIDSDQMRDLVFGLGLNVNNPAGAWPTELASRATSLAEQSGEPLNLNRFAAALIGRVSLAYKQFVEGDHTTTFADTWNYYDVLRGQDIVVLNGEQRIAGTASGIDDTGSLLIRDKQGRSQRFTAGEVTLEKVL
ncbi:MAG: biotin--[acetyl-CoA-carboxylase] ligase [Opitutaceae bacterium]|nr:biotin--[acetyl-CoA-carboxylase] ligase [Opitutaceae bacterium]|tara:strand:+ start:229 stop:1218 length:990 start_codon:yes stop_codon:yes gene_type:complete